MKLLLDTHIFLWSVSDRARLSQAMCEVIDDPETTIYYSAVLSWEIAVKRAKGKLEFSGSPLRVARRIGLIELPLTADDCETAAELPFHHWDPFDRLLVAQARSQRLILATVNPMMERYGIPVLRNR